MVELARGSRGWGLGAGLDKWFTVATIIPSLQGLEPF